MVQIESGVLERTRIVSNVLMVLLVAGNLYFSIQYINNLKTSQAPIVDTSAAEVTKIKNANFLKLFIEKVVKTNGVVAYEDRVQLENDIRQIHNKALTDQWVLYINSNKDPKKAQAAVADLMEMLADGTVK